MPVMIVIQNKPLGMLDNFHEGYNLILLLEERTPTGKILKGDLRKLAFKEWIKRSSQITLTTAAKL